MKVNVTARGNTADEGQTLAQLIRYVVERVRLLFGAGEGLSLSLFDAHREYRRLGAVL